MILIDFNIQFGKFFYSASSENWIMKFLPSLLSGLISLGIAFFVFWLNQRATKRKEKERLKEVREYFYNTLLKFKVGVDNQIKLFDKHISQIKKDKEEKISLFRPTSQVIDASPSQLLSISKNDTFKFFIQNRNDKKHERIKIYASFYDSLILLTEITQQHKTANSLFSNRYNESVIAIEENRDKLIGIIVRAHHQAVRDEKTGSNQDPYFAEMLQAYTAYTKNMKGTLEPIMNIFINPVQDISNTYYSHPDALETLFLCRTINSHYGKIFVNKELDLKGVEHWNKYHKELQTIISQMIDLEFKDFSYGQEIFPNREDF